jgi:hypothetical protein
MTSERLTRQVERALDDLASQEGTPAESPAVVDPPSDRTRMYTHVNFSRMRTSWAGEDLIVIEEIRRQAEDLIFNRFVAAFELMDRVYASVRFQAAALSTGEPLKDRHGHPVWEVNDIGLPREDWTRVTDRDRFNWIHEITIHLFEWEQDAAVYWGDAMFAKGIWEEVFARAYVASPKGTIDDRTQAGHLASMEDRYFAIFQSLVSRRADAIARSMERICQRLKDTASI